MIRENVNLLDPEAVKLFIKKYKSWRDGHKIFAFCAYSDFSKIMKLE